MTRSLLRSVGNLWIDAPRRTFGAGAPLVLLLVLSTLSGCGSDGGSNGPADDATGEAGTVSFEIEVEGSAVEDEALVILGNDAPSESNLRVLRNGDYLRVIFTTVGGQESEIAVDISEWESGEEHSISATWGEGSVSLYVDGTSQGATTYSGTVALPPGTPLYLGSDLPSGDPGGASIRDFEIFRDPPDEAETE